MGQCMNFKKNSLKNKIIGSENNSQKIEEQIQTLNNQVEQPQPNQQVQIKNIEGQIIPNSLKSFSDNLKQKIQSSTKGSSLNLNLRNNDINLEKAITIQIHIKECSNLTSFILNLSDNKIEDISLFWIGVGLSSCINLTELELILNNNILTGDSGVISLLQGIIKCDKINYLKIHLGENSIFSKNQFDGFNSLDKLQNLQKLDLNLSKCNVGDQGLTFIGLALKSCININNLILNLSGSNKITDKGLIQLCNGINKNIKSLNLDLSLNNYIGDNGLCALGQKLETCFDLKILVIQISQNWIFYRGAVGLLSKLRKHGNLTSLELNLSLNYVRSKGKKQVNLYSSKMIRLVNKKLIFY
ncbi:hypothetical protein ABPG74_004643 [Tetrahymena malaccensis]